MLSYGRNWPSRPQFSYGQKLLLRPQCSLTAAIHPFGHNSLMAESYGCGRNTKSSCGRITVTAVRGKGTFGRSLTPDDVTIALYVFGVPKLKFILWKTIEKQKNRFVWHSCWSPTVSYYPTGKVSLMKGAKSFGIIKFIIICFPNRLEHHLDLQRNCIHQWTRERGGRQWVPHPRLPRGWQNWIWRPVYTILYDSDVDNVK